MALPMTYPRPLGLGFLILFLSASTVDAPSFPTLTLTGRDLDGLPPSTDLWVADVHFARGQEAASREDWATARVEMEQSRRLLELVAPKSRELARTLGELGSLAEIRNDLAEADRMLLRALELWRRNGEVGEPLVVTLQMLGMVNWRLGELDLAEGYQREALEILERRGNRAVRYASLQHHRAWVEESRGRLGEARGLLDEALDIKRRLAPDSTTLGYTLATLAQVEHALGAGGRASELAQESLELRRRLAPGSREVMFSLELAARIAAETGNPSGAEAMLIEALAIARRQIPGTDSEARLLFDLGAVERTLGRPGRGEARLRRAMTIVEELALGIGGSHDAVALYRQQFRNDLRLLVELLVDQGRVAEAFAAQERIRAASFLALVRDREVRHERRQAEEAIEQGIDQLDRAIEERWRLEGRLSRAQGKAERRELLRELNRADRRRADLLERLVTPGTVDLLPSALTTPSRARRPETVELGTVQSQLDEGTVLVSFTVGDTWTQVILVTGDDAQAHRLPLGEAELREEVETLRRWILQRHPASPRATQLAEQRQALGLRLFGSVAESMARAKRWVLIPDEPLHRLPFVALELPGPPNGAERALAGLRPFALARSATAHLRWAERSRSGQGVDFVVLADPTEALPDDEPDRRRSRVNSLAHCWPEDLRNAPALEAAREEVERIHRLLPAQHRWLRFGAAATEGELRRLAPRARWLHVAVHGAVNESSPLDSALFLACPNEVTEGRDDGQLRAWEVLEQLRLDAELVVLAACSSGLGTEVGGEGLLGLGRAFEVAGARAVLASLWRVDDPGTRELMERFYRDLGRGVRKDEALLEAQRWMIESQLGNDSGPLSHPWYWASFQLWGDGR